MLDAFAPLIVNINEVSSRFDLNEVKCSPMKVNGFVVLDRIMIANFRETPYGYSTVYIRGASSSWYNTKNWVGVYGLLMNVSGANLSMFVRSGVYAVQGRCQQAIHHSAPCTRSSVVRTPCTPPYTLYTLNYILRHIILLSSWLTDLLNSWYISSWHVIVLYHPSRIAIISSIYNDI